ncbi:hypothetical protein PVAND_004908 [Polypedilum vanderplanki]|uniref:Bifunctional polynucleotide phosphatase/kinase n=1 Tax=Polypedilum vanderplanki TaxID=319348 RepID=A0A9J6BYJ6_POLVA|nr:hypothetical protein PVAND_004908 [Polypedilum vanderplanki]
MARFILQNLGENEAKGLPDLTITERMIIGRNKISQIQTPIVSREHLIVKPDFKQKVLLIKFCGKSPAALNNFILDKSEAYEAKENDIISLVFETDFKYRVVFVPEKSEENKTSQKRRSEDDLNMVENEEGNDKLKRQKTDETKWDMFDNNKCLVYTSRGVVASDKIAAYDMDGTLIKTCSGNVFPKSIDDWQLNMSEIPKKLKKLHENGFKIVVFTNQAGIETKKVTISEVKQKITMISERLEVPVQFFIATSSTNYRKPRTGMWELLQENFNDGIKIDKTSSFFVGDAAGRPENKILKKKKDHSSADRLFALNLDLNFYTPEEHFQNQRKNPSFIRPEYNPKASSDALNLLEPVGAKLKLNEVELIIMVGYPASGKSYFCNNYLKKEGYEVVNRDTLNSMQKCITNVEEALKNKKSCVVDNTNPDVASRKKFIDIAKKIGVKVRCFIMTTTYHHARHNNIFRELIETNHSKINDLVFNTYKSKYVEPTLKEGFDEIVKVNFLPNFDNEKHETLYRMYLLEK